MEIEFVRWLRTRLTGNPCLQVGPGDDAAVLRMGKPSEVEVVTCDLLCDGIHFRTGQDSPRRIGRKALAVNLSDLAAMAARPIAGFCALALPRDGLQLAEGLIEGMLPLAGEFDLAIAGGDTNVWDGPLVISITLSGRCDGEKTLLRSGARPGDHLLTTGQFGGSLLGHQFDFEPRVHEAIYLNEHYTLHAGIDCSDGLGLDLARLAEESGCGAAIDLAAVPVAEAARQLAGESEDGVSAIDHALSDGEDFELLLAVPPDDAEQIVSRQPLDVNVTRIGTFVEQPGLWQTTESGLLPLEARGYQHRVGR